MLTFERIILGGDGDLAGDVRRVLSGEWSAFDDPHAFDFLARAWEAQGTRAVAQEMARAVAEALTDPNTVVRAQAVHFFAACHGADDGGWIGAALGQDAMFLDVSDPVRPSDGRDLKAVLARAASLRPMLMADADVLAAVRDEALRPAAARLVVVGLFKHDRTWLLAHLPDIVVAAPDAFGPVLMQMLLHDVDPSPTLQRLRGRLTRDALQRELDSLSIPDEAKAAYLDALG